MTISSQVLLQSSLPLGPQGIQGVQGTQGTQGIQGVQGTQGTQGVQGDLGIQGSQGLQGIQGIQGLQGIQGVLGAQGNEGMQGVQGIIGSQGIQGTQGVQGDLGVQGSFGLQGTDGAQGIQGVQGLQGLGSDQFLNTTSNVTFASVTTPLINLTGHFAEKFVNIAAATGTVAHDCSQGSLFNHVNIVNTFTVNVTNLNLAPGYTGNIVLILNQTSTAYVPNAIEVSGVARPIFWQGGVLPFGNALKKDLVSFSFVNNAGTYTVFGQLVSFG